MIGRLHSQATLSQKEDPLSNFDPSEGAYCTGGREITNTSLDMGGVGNIPCSSENPVVIKKYINIYKIVFILI
jgi:hypothetical protein